MLQKNKKGSGPKPGGLSSTGSVTSTQSSGSSVLMSFHENIPASAKLPCAQEVLWVNQKGQSKPRQVVGDKVLLRQQPAAPPPEPEVLVLSDQMLAQFQNPDKYLRCHIMPGYTIKDYTNDIHDSMTEINFKYIIVFLGTMHVAMFQQKAVAKQITEFVKVVNEITPNTLIMFSGLVPRPLDHPESRMICHDYTRTYIKVTEELRMKNNWNCVALSVYDEFLNQQGDIDNPMDHFLEGLYLTKSGIHVLRAAWLRRLGYFPQKAVKSVQGTV